MARPRWHALSALPLMAVGILRDGPVSAVAAAVGAVLIDADHLVDWALNGSPESHPTRVFIPLHGWEFPLTLLLGARLLRLPVGARAPLRALASGWACHLLLDSLVNGPASPLAYSILVRLRRRFHRVASGWPPAVEEPRRQAASNRPAAREALLAASLGIVMILMLLRHAGELAGTAGTPST